MKTILLSAVLTMIGYAAIAEEKNEKTIASYQTIKSLEAEFGHVQNVKWSISGNNMTRADFELDAENVSAFFAETGEFIASTQEISYYELPKKLQVAVKQKLADGKIGTMLKMNTRDETSWYIEVMYNDEKKIWKGNLYGELRRFKVNG